MAARAAEVAHDAALDAERKAREAIERRDKINMDLQRDTKTKVVKEGGQPRKTGPDESTVVQSTGVVWI